MTDPFEPHSLEDDEEFSEEELRLARRLAAALEDPRADAGDVEPLLETASLVRGRRDFDLSEARRSEIRAELGREWEKADEVPTSNTESRRASSGRVIRLLRISAVPIALAAAVLFSLRGQRSGPQMGSGQTSVAVRVVEEDAIFPEPPAALVLAQAAVIAESAQPPSSHRFAAQRDVADAKVAADVQAEKKSDDAISVEARRELDRELALYRRRLLASWEKNTP